MATLELREGSAIEADVVRRLARKAVSLNRPHGDPTRSGGRS